VNESGESQGKFVTGPTAFDRVLVKLDAQRLVVEVRNSPWMIALTLFVFFTMGSIFLWSDQFLGHGLVLAFVSWTLGIVLATILVMGKERLVLDRCVDRFEYKPRYRRISMNAPLGSLPEPTVVWDTDHSRMWAPYRLRFKYSHGNLDMFIRNDRFDLNRLRDEISTFLQKGRGAV
jgi:hypothetical protein